MVPWFLFLFVGAFDFGFFSYSLVATQSAARMAALYASTSSTTAANPSRACFFALEELRDMPNVTSSLSTCTSGAVTNAAPVGISTQSVTGADGAAAAQVTVSYLTIPLIPIPGLLTARTTIVRMVQMRVRG